MFNPFRILVDYTLEALPFRVGRSIGGYRFHWKSSGVRIEAVREFENTVADGQVEAVGYERYVLRVAESWNPRLTVELAEAWVAVTIARTTAAGHEPDVVTIAERQGLRPKGFGFWSKPALERSLGPFYVGISSGRDEDKGIAAYRSKCEREKTASAVAPAS